MQNRRTSSFAAYSRAKKAGMACNRRSMDALSKMVVDIAGHSETVIISHEDDPMAWSYVAGLFPKISEAIYGAKIYKNENLYFLKKVGYPASAAGLFVPPGSIIISRSGFPIDVVVVHELLHYASKICGSRGHNAALEEEIAYSRSVPYLLDRGYDVEWVCQHYLLPYFVGIESRDNRSQDETKDIGLLRAKSFVDKCLLK